MQFFKGPVQSLEINFEGSFPHLYE